MIKYIKKTLLVIPEFFGALLRLIFQRQPKAAEKLFKYAVVDDIPEHPKPQTLYLCGENGQFWAAALVCPCGCGETVQLNLLTQARPCWSVQRHDDGVVTVDPSVWRKKGCMSHFFIRRGRVDWC